MKIFISHSSQDAVYAESIVKFLINIGVKREQIFCSSVDGCGIRLGANIPETIRKEFLENDIYAIMLLSENYYASAICLNEMGAAWIAAKEQLAILLPGFKHEQIRGVVDANDIYMKLDADNITERLLDFHDLIREKFEIKEHVSYRDLHHIIKEFSESISVRPDNISINLSNSRPLCIGEDDSAGCTHAIGQISEKSVTYIVDYAKTNATICSLVIYPEIKNWRQLVSAGASLSFNISAKSDVVRNMIVEIKRGGTTHHIQKEVQIFAGKRMCHVSLPTSVNMGEWEDVQEICLLMYRGNDEEKNVITIEEMVVET